MKQLKRDELMSLEVYAQERDAFRARIFRHKQGRRLAVGPHLTLYFEDRLTMQYQIQEMLRAERIFETVEIEAELAAYNPLIPDGNNWKATAMIEYPDPAERQQKLRVLRGIEDLIWMQVTGCDKVYAIADEDMVRSDQEKTSAVHFLRFQLDAEMVDQAHQGAAIRAGVDHDAYRHELLVAPAIRESLLADLRD